MLGPALAVPLTLAAGYLGVGLFVVLRMTAPDRGPMAATPASVGLGYEEIELRSTDGIRLGAWWVPSEGSSKAAVLVPGWGGYKSEGHVLGTAPAYHDAGYGVLMLDLRAQGESGGGRRTLGYREVRDVRGALAWLEERGYAARDVVLHGWSMGGATAVRAAPGAGVAAVVEEAGYADLPILLKDKIPQVTGLPAFFTPAILLFGRLFPDFDPWSVRPEKDAAKLSKEGVPLFIIHSPEDRIVPYEHAEMFAWAYPDAEFWRLEGYEHVEGYAHPEYRRRLWYFLESSASGEENRPGFKPGSGPADPGR